MKNVRKMRVRLRPIVPGKASGEVLVVNDSISFYGGVDPETGIIVDRHSPAYGKSVANKILIFEGGRGSTVGSYVIYALKRNNVAPKAMVVMHSEPIIVVGAALARIPLADKPEKDLLKLLKTGTEASVYVSEGEAYIER